MQQENTINMPNQYFPTERELTSSFEADFLPTYTEILEISSKIMKLREAKIKSSQANEDVKTKLLIKLLSRAPLTPKVTQEDLINLESDHGRHIFGKIPAGHQREFFHHKNNIWIWHENWKEGIKEISNTVRYEVTPNGIFKRVNGERPTLLIEKELSNFHHATRLYLHLISKGVYS